MSLFKKPKRNFRKKETSTFDSDDEIGDTQENDNESSKITAATSSSSSKNKPAKKAKEYTNKSSSSILSFEVDDDDEEGTFKVKKTSTSRRISKQLKKEKRQQMKEEKNGNGKKHESEEEDEEEDEEEISWKTRKAEIAKKKKLATEEEKQKAEQKLKALREEFRTMNGDEAEALDEDDDEKVFKNRLARGEIPDAKTIHYIRKQRQMARDTDGYIALPEEEKESTKPTKSTARLVRDDENDKSDEEEDGRMDFSVNQAARDRQQLRDNFLAAEHGSDEDSDHDRQWESQQIKKATSLQIPGFETSASSSPRRSDVHFAGSTEFDRPSAMDCSTSKPFAALASTQDSSEINIEIVRKRLEERLSTVDTVYRTHKLEHERTISDLDSTKESEELCRNKVSLLENRYRFFQELRGCQSYKIWSSE